MRHGVKTVKLGRTASHRRSMMKNLATSVLRQGISPNQADRAVVTTVEKAKAVRGLVDRLITYAKKGDLAARRQAAKFVDDAEVLAALFEKIGPRYQNRQGGYTRVLKLQKHRVGDAAQLAMIELVDNEVAPAAVPPKKEVAKKSVPKKETVKKSTTEEEVIKKSAAKKEETKKSTAEEGVTKKSAPKKEETEKSASVKGKAKAEKVKKESAPEVSEPAPEAAEPAEAPKPETSAEG